MSTQPWPARTSLRNVWPPNVYEPGSWKPQPGVRLCKRQRGERHERFVGRARRIGAMQRAIQQRMIGRVVELSPRSADRCRRQTNSDRSSAPTRTRARRRWPVRLRPALRGLPANACSATCCRPMSSDSWRLLPGVAWVRDMRANGAPAGGHFDFLKTGLAVQFRLVALLDADLADVVGALVVVRVEARIVVVRCRLSF